MGRARQENGWTVSTWFRHLTALVDRGGGRTAMIQVGNTLSGGREKTSGDEDLGVGNTLFEKVGCPPTG